MDFLFFILLMGGVAYMYNRRRATKFSNNHRANGRHNQQFGGVMAGAVGGAATMMLLNHLHSQHQFDANTMENMHQMDYEQLQQFALDQGLMQQEELNQIFDPYTNPGTDIVVDEHYHGINHGLDDSFDDNFGHDFGSHDSGGFGGGFGDF